MSDDLFGPGPPPGGERAGPPAPPDPVLLRAFRNTVIHATQVNGDFFTREGIAMAVSGCRRMLAERSPLDDLFDRFGRPS